MIDAQALSEKKLITIIRTLPPSAVEQVLDFALFIQARQAVVDAGIDVRETEAEILADDARWDAQFAASREKLQGLGRKARDNDYLTFRLARSLDTWLHAADYPGSHVVIRNAAKREIPPKTLLEAAQLAAFYSQGKSQVKAAVNYTQKKFVNKRKGFAPGLVSLAKFKTILVEPKVDGPKPRD